LKGTEEEFYTVAEDGVHCVEVRGHDRAHGPQRVRYPWISAQKKHIEMLYQNNSNITPQQALRGLEEAGLRRGMQLKQTQMWVKNARSGGSVPVVDTRLSGLASLVSACKAFSIAWDGPEEDRPILLPIPGRDYVLTGKEAALCGRKTKTVNKTPVSYCIPMSTETLLRNRIAARKETHLAFKEVTLKKGAIMEKTQSLGLSNIDGVHSVLKGIRAHMHIHTPTHITHTQHPRTHTRIHSTHAHTHQGSLPFWRLGLAP
jgi:hypothetical protein